MVRIRNNNASYRTLLAFWKKHCAIEKWHIDWLKENIEVHQYLPKGEIIHLEGERHKYIYFVCRGAVARIRYDTNYKIHILSLALPEMALMSTSHLYSSTPSKGNIIALHSRTSIIKIPYTAITAIPYEIPEIQTLINILSNKKKSNSYNYAYLVVFRSQVSVIYGLQKTYNT